jgi:hypothetical protein
MKLLPRVLMTVTVAMLLCSHIAPAQEKGRVKMFENLEAVQDADPERPINGLRTESRTKIR